MLSFFSGSRNLFKAPGYQKAGTGLDTIILLTFCECPLSISDWESFWYWYLIFTHLGTAGKGGTTAGAQKGVDIEAVGSINGIPAYDFDLETLQSDEKPWRKPG